MEPPDGRTAALALQRVRAVSDQSAALGTGGRVLMRVLDGLALLPRLALWALPAAAVIVTAVMDGGVSGPRGGRRGDRGPVRRRIAQALLRARVPEPVSVAEALRAADGHPVAVRGRVRPCAPFPDSAVPPAVVFQLVRFRLRVVVSSLTRKWDLVYEAAADFDLVDEHGAQLRVLVDRAYLAALTPRLRSGYWPVSATPATLPRPPAQPLARALERGALLAAADVQVKEGDEVVVWGVKDRIVDATAPGARLARETPMRSVLRAGGPAEPLLVLRGKPSARPARDPRGEMPEAV